MKGVKDRHCRRAGEPAVGENGENRRICGADERSWRSELGILFQEKDRGGLSDANHLAQCGDVVVLDGMGPSWSQRSQ